jgi:nucleoside-diphosphate kinase
MQNIEITLAIIKPDGVKRKLVGACISRFENAELDIDYLVLAQISKTQVYSLKEPQLKSESDLNLVYPDLENYMTEGPSAIILISGNNAVTTVRKICGHANPVQAEKGTIRGDYGLGDMLELAKQRKAVRNVIHSSANLDDAKREITLFFNRDNCFNYFYRR